MPKFFTFMSAGGMTGLTAIPLLVAPEHLAWTFWRVAICVCLFFGLAGLVLQLCFQGREEKKEKQRQAEKDRARDEHQQKLDAKMTEILERITSGLPSKPTEEPIRSSNLVVLTPHEHLQQAQEAVFVEEVLAMPDDQLRINLGHDREFRSKFDAVPKGKYPRFDEFRAAIIATPIIAARFVRAHLMPWSPFSDMVKDLFKAMGKPAYETRADFLF